MSRSQYSHSSRNDGGMSPRWRPAPAHQRQPLYESYGQFEEEAYDTAANFIDRPFGEPLSHEQERVAAQLAAYVPHVGIDDSISVVQTRLENGQPAHGPEWYQDRGLLQTDSHHGSVYSARSHHTSAPQKSDYHTGSQHGGKVSGSVHSMGLRQSVYSESVYSASNPMGTRSVQAASVRPGSVRSTSMYSIRSVAPEASQHGDSQYAKPRDAGSQYAHAHQISSQYAQFRHSASWPGDSHYAGFQAESANQDGTQQEDDNDEQSDHTGSQYTQSHQIASRHGGQPHQRIQYATFSNDEVSQHDGFRYTSSAARRTKPTRSHPSRSSSSSKGKMIAGKTYYDPSRNALVRKPRKK